MAFHGFASQGYLISGGNDYLVEDTRQGSFQFTEMGLNVTAEPVEKVRLGIQAFAADEQTGGNFNLQADWFYVDYHWKDWLGIRTGRLKIPFGFYNEVNDIDAARVPILLPQSVYPLQGREFLFAQTGGEVYGFLRSSLAGGLEYRLYGGTIYIDPRILTPPGSPVSLDFDVRHVFGGRALWETPLPGLRAAVSAEQLALDLTAYAGGSVAGTIQNQSVLAMGSVEYAQPDFVATAEYSQWQSRQTTSGGGTSSSSSDTSERSYAMLCWNATRWLHPASYFALYYPDITKRHEGGASVQNDLALTLRLDVNAAWIVKFEGHYMSGSAGLVNPISIGPPPVNPADRWGVFLVKTTGYF